LLKIKTEMKMEKFVSVVFLSLSVIFLSGCGSGQQKGNDSEAGEKTEITAEFQKEQQELVRLANEELSSINKKIMELNEKIQEEGTGLTDAQNEAIDEFEDKRKSVNNRLNEIESVSEEEWESFKTKFEDDLDKVKSKIDEILAEF
jgi:TolA-binding protein